MLVVGPKTMAVSMAEARCEGINRLNLDSRMGQHGTNDTIEFQVNQGMNINKQQFPPFFLDVKTRAPQFRAISEPLLRLERTGPRTYQAAALRRAKHLESEHLPVHADLWICSGIDVV